MKTKFKYFLFAATVMLTASTGCRKFLQVEQLGRTSMPIFFSDMDGVRAGMAGAYSSVYTYYSSHFSTYPEIAGDMLSLNLNLASESQKNIYNFNSIPDDEVGPVGKIWSDIYIALANINNLLFYLPDLETNFPQFTDELKMYRAESLFLRALCHFDLSRVYAQPYAFSPDGGHLGIPVLKQTPGPDDNPSRKPLNQVYDFIISDLKEADKAFDGTDSRGVYYAGQLAARALLSRVYLYKGDWDSTIKYAGLVIDKMPLTNADSYIKSFTNLTGNDGEGIFRLNGLDKSSSLLSFYNMAPVMVNGNVTGYTTPISIPSGKFLELFDGSDDIRFNELLDKDSTSAGVFYATGKFNVVQSSSSSDKQYYNPFVIRLSEVYLNRAEALLNKDRLQQAASDLKPIMARALNKNVNEIIVNETDKQILAKTIYDERAKELAFEGHRLFDLLRRKSDLNRDDQTNAEVKKITFPDDRFVLPISQKELDANTNMVGNPTVNR